MHHDPNELATAKPPADDDVRAARSAGLRHVNDHEEGYRRLRVGKTFRYVGTGHKPIKDPAVLKRIHALVIPPAWQEVWICQDAKGHLQATGRDARGRKQYRYHPGWRARRDETKFHRMLAFGRALPALRHRVQRDLRAPGLGRRKVLATLVRLLDLTAIRIGNEEYASQNKSFGLTTLEDRHARIRGPQLTLQFRGKSGKHHTLCITNPAVARIVKRCQDLPGQELFQWLDETGARHRVHSGDVNEYLCEVSGEQFTSKDFRTWAGTVLAAHALAACGVVGSEAKARTLIAEAIRSVAEHLGNTLTVCRKSYVHPAVISGYHDGTLHDAMRRLPGRTKSTAPTRLRPEEHAVLALLRRKK